MQNRKLTYIVLVIVHILLAGILFTIPIISKLYSILIIVVGIAVVVKSSNRNNEVLYVAAYLIGSEVFLRMTGGNFLNEYTKYSVLFFMVLGMFYSGFSKSSVPYWFYLVLLIPGIIVSSTTLNLETDIRKAIAFNISGPVCLGISAIYCYRRKVTLKQLNNIIMACALPILSTAVYLFLYTPSVKAVVTGTASNFETSGGFGPNQVATILGLGIFLFFVQIILNSSPRKINIINGLILGLVAYRAIVTFSRGGVITGIAMIILLLGVLYFFSNGKGKFKVGIIVTFSVIGALGIWTYSSLQTRGLIEKRYSNEDAMGRVKESQLSGREELFETEIQMFLEHPLLGIGVGKNKEYRMHLTGIEAASHSEMTRMLAEHGSLGILALLILLFTPLLLYLDNQQHIYLLSFFIFWLLTINHAAMRIAAPAFIYALSLLKVTAVEETTLHRE